MPVGEEQVGEKESGACRARGSFPASCVSGCYCSRRPTNSLHVFSSLDEEYSNRSLPLETYCLPLHDNLHTIWLPHYPTLFVYSIALCSRLATHLAITTNFLSQQHHFYLSTDYQSHYSRPLQPFPLVKRDDKRPPSPGPRHATIKRPPFGSLRGSVNGARQQGPLPLATWPISPLVESDVSRWLGTKTLAISCCHGS
jgi:hypothetical protein